MIVSCWELTQEEKMEILREGKIWLVVMGQAQPPVFIGSSTQLEKFLT